VACHHDVVRGEPHRKHLRHTENGHGRRADEEPTGAQRDWMQAVTVGGDAI
jgi:hypothetical protein